MRYMWCPAAVEMMYKRGALKQAQDAIAAGQSTGPADMDEVLQQLAGNVGPQQEDLEAKYEEDEESVHLHLSLLRQRRDEEDCLEDEPIDEAESEEEEQYVAPRKRGRYQAKSAAAARRAGPQVPKPKGDRPSQKP